MDHRNDHSLFSPPGQMISPHGVPMMQDGFYTYEYCRLVGASYRQLYAQAQEYQHLNDPWQQNHRALLLLHLRHQNNHVNMPWAVFGDEEEDSLDDLASEDGIENNDAWEEDTHSDDDAMEIESDLEQIDVYMLVPEEDGGPNYNEGLQEDTIFKNLKTRSYLKEDEVEMCVVCQQEYEDNETLGILGCGHEFHSDCIKTWLLHKNLCPLCKQTAIVL